MQTNERTNEKNNQNEPAVARRVVIGSCQFKFVSASGAMQLVQDTRVSVFFLLCFVAGCSGWNIGNDAGWNSSCEASVEWVCAGVLQATSMATTSGAPSAAVCGQWDKCGLCLAQTGCGWCETQMSAACIPGLRTNTTCGASWWYDACPSSTDNGLNAGGITGIVVGVVSLVTSVVLGVLGLNHCQKKKLQATVAHAGVQMNQHLTLRQSSLPNIPYPPSVPK